MKVVLLLAWMSASAVAEESTWQHCRAITEDAVRLACYDALATATPSTMTAPIAATATTSSASEVAATATVTATTDSAMKSTVPTAIVAKVEREQTAAEFGLERKAAEMQLEQLVSRIPGQFNGWEAKTKITLENGQVWQVSDGSHGVYKLENPVVTIERGTFGAFFLKIEGVNRMPKVKRLK